MQFNKMNKSKFAVIIIFVLRTIQTNALVLQCEFKIEENEWPSYTSSYTCLATVIFTGDMRKVERIDGTNLEDKTLEMVQCLKIYKQEEVRKIPRNLYKFFPSLEAIKITSTNLNEISKDDFINLPKLKVFDFFFNEIEKVGNNVFDNQKNVVEAVSFAYNPLKYLGYTNITEFTKLTILHFFGTCQIDHEEGEVEGHEDSLKLWKTAADNCRPTIQMIEELIYEKCERSHEEEINALKKELITKFKCLVGGFRDVNVCKTVENKYLEDLNDQFDISKIKFI